MMMIFLLDGACHDETDDQTSFQPRRSCIEERSLRKVWQNTFWAPLVAFCEEREFMGARQQGWKEANGWSVLVPGGGTAVQ